MTSVTENKKSLLKHYRLTQSEYARISQLIKHSPSRLELALFSALWSEHCSYKSSALHLKKLFFSSKKVVSAFGENAGVMDLGQGEKVAFKIESHNHPSQITPYHGASTGVGGILRDVFVMNARPIALANYLCFGQPCADSTGDLVDGVVRGIGGYGNSIGVPTITGQTHFHSAYNKNIVVNAFALGYFGPEKKVMSSKATGEGQLLVYVGARTGKDGVHGASMASESFTPLPGEVAHSETRCPASALSHQGETSENKTASVQIGDPFYGKLLMEACLSAMRQDLVVAGQDMGAAGLISSSFEMISKGNMGMKMYLDTVPLRDSTMTVEEILLSESQERALLVVAPDKYTELKKIFEKWGLPVVAIGELTQKREVEIFWKKRSLVRIDPALLNREGPSLQSPLLSLESSAPCSKQK